MALTADILQSWRHPGQVVRRLRAAGKSEPFVFTFLFVFLLMAFVANAPYVSRQATLNPEVALVPGLFGSALGLLATIPLFYGLAALGHLVARLMGGQGGWYDGRLALFWALACVTPPMLMLGLVRAMLGDVPAVTYMGFAIFFAFAGLYSLMLKEVEGQ